MDEDPQDPTLGPEPPQREIRSKYEFVMAASKEAERLNDYYRNRGIAPEDKVTVEAVRRIRLGQTKVSYEDASTSGDELRRETTYFFGS